MSKYITVENRIKENKKKFEDYILPEPNSGCWLWIGRISKQGYGCYKLNGESIAHRVSYELHKEEIPYGIHVCHTCDNPSCVNPDHLFLGTNAENMKDRNNKQRQARGDKIHTSKLNHELVNEIRSKYIPHKYTIKMLAKEYNVSTSTIFCVLKKKYWGYLL